MTLFSFKKVYIQFNLSVIEVQYTSIYNVGVFVPTASYMSHNVLVRTLHLHKP